MKRLKSAISALAFPVIGYRPQRVDSATWDREYREGQWDYLRRIDSLAGLASILGYCKFLQPKAILDVGCGEGLLAELLKLLDHQSYLGIDVSGEAIARARANLGDARTLFDVADAHRFETHRRFDLIVFNQSLYYLDDPVAVLCHYKALLNDGGHVIVSMADQPRTRVLWPLVEKVLYPRDAMDIRQGRGRVITKVMTAR